MPHYAFKMLSGKYQGGEYILPEVGEVVVGRAAEVDLVLVEDMVSRRHARIVAAHGQLTLTDLDSTNGTFVNGEKIQQAKLSFGDRVLIGTSILKLIACPDATRDGMLTHTHIDHSIARAEVHAPSNAMAVMLASLPAEPATPSTTMSGELDELPLPDLLLLFATNRKGGTIVLAGRQAAQIVIREGELWQARAQAPGKPDICGMQALCKALTLTHGTFICEPLADAASCDREFDGSTENALLEATRRNDEADRAAQQLAAGRGQLALVVPLTQPLSALRAELLDTLQLAINQRDVAKILALATSSPEATVAHLQALLNDGYLVGTAPREASV